MESFLAFFYKTVPAFFVTLPALLTTAARTSYPWPLAWGNALWGIVAFRIYRASLPEATRPGWTFSWAVTFLFYTMPANLCTNLFLFVRTPSALKSDVILPVHLVSE